MIETAAESAIASQRGCDACGSDRATPLFTQRFRRFDDGAGLPGYDVVACAACGFVYADGIPEQAVFDRYYRDLSKYESHQNDGHVPAWTARTHRAIVAEIADRLPARDARILDVGAADGHLLSCFREAGFENVLGLDPSARCAEAARDLYGVRVVNTPFSAMAFAGERFDIVLLSSVLEHMRDLEPTLRGLKQLLKPDGALWIEVPDASRFTTYAGSPFHQFSLEHINFFSAQSLRRLMGRAGLVERFVWQTVRTIDRLEDPGLDALFSAGDVRAPVGYDASGVAAVRDYAARCLQLERELCGGVGTFVRAQTPVIVWGTGSLALRLLGLETFRKLDIVAFADGNANYQGRTIGGIAVLSPLEMRERSETILVVSHACEPDIVASIRERHGLKNAVFGVVSATSYPA